MAIPRTYAGIVSAIVDLAEDDSTEFSSYIPTAIYLAEQRLIKEIDLKDLIVTTTVTASADDPIIAQPSNMRFLHDVWYTTSVGREFPTLKENDFVRDYWPVTTSTSAYPNGKPKYYGLDDGDNFVLGPIPASAYQFTVKYVESPTPLSAANSTNAFTDKCADALFYATMIGMAEFMKDYTTLQVWEARYINAIKGMENQTRRERRDDGTNPNNPDGSSNTLRGK